MAQRVRGRVGLKLRSLDPEAASLAPIPPNQETKTAGE